MSTVVLIYFHIFEQIRVETGLCLRPHRLVTLQTLGLLAKLLTIWQPLLPISRR